MENKRSYKPLAVIGDVESRGLEMADPCRKQCRSPYRPFVCLSVFLFLVFLSMAAVLFFTVSKMQNEKRLLIEIVDSNGGKTGPVFSALDGNGKGLDPDTWRTVIGLLSKKGRGKLQVKENIVSNLTALLEMLNGQVAVKGNSGVGNLMPSHVSATLNLIDINIQDSNNNNNNNDFNDDNVQSDSKYHSSKSVNNSVNKSINNYEGSFDGNNDGNNNKINSYDHNGNRFGSSRRRGNDTTVATNTTTDGILIGEDGEDKFGDDNNSDYEGKNDGGLTV